MRGPVELCGVLGAQEDLKAAMEECKELKARVSDLQEQLSASRDAERELENDMRVEVERQTAALDYRSVFLKVFY